jgi:hypothetical protein
MEQNRLATQIWGHNFELAVKRGVLYYLLHVKLISKDTPGLEDWFTYRIQDIIDHNLTQLKILNSHKEAQLLIQNYFKHQLVTGYGLGWTVMRTWIQNIQSNEDKNKLLRLERLWAPFSKPIFTPTDLERELRLEERLTAFSKLMDIPRGENWATRGQPPQADFLLALRGWDEQIYALCLEFSLNALPEPGDFCTEQAHLDELSQYIKLIERRGVFSRINAEFSAGEFKLSERMVEYMSNFTTRDKPLYKMLQGCSYLCQWVKLMTDNKQFSHTVQAQVIAVTAAGLETMHATLGQDQPGTKLMESFGLAYRNLSKSEQITETIRQRIASSLFHQLAKALPKTMRGNLNQQLDEANRNPENSYQLVLQETLKSDHDFINPNTKLPRDRLLDWACADDSAKSFFSQPLRLLLEKNLENSGKSEYINLRDIHTASIKVATEEAKTNQLTVLGLEGHPGIGKTTSLLQAVRSLQTGWLFIYISPRVLINDEVTQSLADDDVLAMTTNYILNSGAVDWYKKYASTYPVDISKPNSAVCFKAKSELIIPQISTLFLTPEQANQITYDLARTGYKNHQLDYQTQKVNQIKRPGVMETLAKACKAALKTNPNWNKILLTASIQSYRVLAQKTNTVEKLLKQLFYNQPVNTSELDSFATRIRTIIVMVDEITGDGAGAHVVHEFAAGLRKYFLRPYQLEERDSPFKLILALADASLGNEVMLRSYLEEDAVLRRYEQSLSSPEKILISPGRPKRAFGLSCLDINLGQQGKKTPVLHIMADSFPASRLDIEYRVEMTPVRLEKKGDTLQRPREAIQKTATSTINLAISCILQELKTLPADEQIILFVQNKLFLRKLEFELQNFDKLIKREEIAKLDSSLDTKQRRDLMQLENRNRVRVWLMTSSGSRGVSFPKVSRIIAFMPRFAVEGNLMEIAQLIYRGRGQDGDNLARKLVLLIQDFIFYETGENLDTVMWTRRTIDIVTMLVLLRATIMTRIKGHADIQGQNISLVPVGKIVTDEMVQTISEVVNLFFTEAENCKQDMEQTEQQRNIAGEAVELVKILFLKSDWCNQRHTQYTTSPTQKQYWYEFITQVSKPHHFVLTDSVPELLPENVSCTGPLIFEHWSEGYTAETLSQEGWDKQLEYDLKKLIDLLAVISSDKFGFADKLRRHARDLRDIINNYGSEIRHEYKTIKQIDTKQIWVIMPTDYPRFLSRNGESLNLLYEHEWLNKLSTAASLYVTPSARHPLFPKYNEYPFFAMISQDDPTHRRLFNSRYFSATADMNLLNVLLCV